MNPKNGLAPALDVLGHSVLDFPVHGGTIPDRRRHLGRYAVFGTAYRQRAKLRALVPMCDDEPSGAPAPCSVKTGPPESRGPSCCAWCSPPTCWRAREAAGAACAAMSCAAACAPAAS